MTAYSIIIPLVTTLTAKAVTSTSLQKIVDLETNQPIKISVNYRSEILNESDDDDPPELISEEQATFQSLLELMSNTQSDHNLIVFLKESIRTNTCFVEDLCSNYPLTFKSRGEGRLSSIYLDDRFKMDHLDLLMLPSSLETLRMHKTDLKSISKWTDLKGKRLKKLEVLGGNPDLVLDLDELSDPQSGVPLKVLRISKAQTMTYFGVIGRWMVDPCFDEIAKWVSASTLDMLTVTRNRHHPSNTAVFYKDGRLNRGFSRKE